MIKKNILLLLALSIVIIASSCGQQNQNGDEVLGSSIIVGDLDWKEVTSLSSTHPIRVNSKAVADIDLPVMGSRCTGFMITEDILMTNQHCIPSSSYARGVTARFNHELNVQKSDIEEFDCSTFIGNNEELDFALLKCSGSPGRKYGVVSLSADAERVGASVYVIQQNCDYYSKSDCDWTKKYSLGSITKVADEYSHNADTLGGSSGSPVFSNSSNKVVALHHAGYGNNGMGRGYENYAVPMSKILPVLKARFGLFSGTGGSSGGSSLIEGGKSFKTAKLVSAGVLSGKLDKLNDVDFFRFSVAKTTSIEVSLSFQHSVGDLDLVLYNSSGAVVKVSEGTSNLESIKQTISSGEYTIKVYGYRGATGAYQLALK